MRLKGRVALVTGGGTGIGRGVCLALAREGCSVAVNYSRSKAQAEEVARIISETRVSSLAVRADVSQDCEVKEMVKQVVTALGPIDILVNNAGYTRRIPHREMQAVDEETLDRIIGVNIKGPFYCIRAVAPLMLKTGSGVVVNITSDSAYHGDGSSIIYCAAKAALANMTKSLARCFAPSIRFNAVAPGFVDTGFVKWEAGVKERAAERNPMGCITTVEDVAKTVLFLILDAPHITAESVLVDGGETVLGPRV